MASVAAHQLELALSKAGVIVFKFSESHWMLGAKPEWELNPRNGKLRNPAGKLVDEIRASPERTAAIVAGHVNG